MTELYKVRCTTASGRMMAGVHAVAPIGNGAFVTWEPKRAAVQDCRADAEILVSRMGSIFPGTVWVIEAVGVAQ